MHRHFLLLCFAALTVAARLRFGLGALAWVAPVPALLWLRHARGWRASITLVGVGCVAWTLATLKIITAPLPAAFAPIFGIPLGLFQTLPLLTYAALRRRGAGPWTYAVLMITAEWLQYSFTPFASWGAVAYSQVDLLPLMQLAALGGLSAIGFVVHGVTATIEVALADGWPRARRRVFTALAVVVCALAGGQARLEWAGTRGAQTTRVALVDTDSDVSGLPLPTSAQTAEWDATLLDRTERAAAAGATVVVWTEAATLVRPEEMERWLSARSADAARLEIDLVVGVVTPIETEPLRFENRYFWFAPDGSLEHAYRKRFPVPMEPAVAGEAPAPVVVRGAVRMSGAICYDFDFPEMAHAHGARGVGLAVVPSSDWRGIDPFHSQMARLRAIEGGFSLARATRFGLSVATDATGRIRAWHSAFEGGPGFTIADVPTAPMPTLTAHWGDWPVAAGWIGLLLGTLRRRRRDA